MSIRERMKKWKSKVFPIRKKQKRNWQKFFQIFAYQWKDFFDNSTFVGLRLIAGTGKKSKIWSTIYLIIWISCFVYGFWACQNVLMLYFSNKLKTTITYNEVQELQFPAVSFCNMNTFRRSVISGDDSFIFFLSALEDKIPDEIQKRYKLNKKLCYNNSSEDRQLGAQAVNIDDFETLGRISRESSIDSNLTVKRCWWNKEEISCDESFSNTPIDSHFCFSFNKNMNNLLDNKLGINRNSLAYGAENAIVRTLKQFGPNTGLQLLFDFQQKEYCGIQQPDMYYGAGLNVLIHDPKYLPSFELGSHVLLHPGFVYDITVRPVKSILNTQRIGRCRSTSNSFMKASTYQRQACFFICMIDYLWKHCRCTFHGADAKLLAQYLGVSSSDLHSCHYLNTFNCYKLALLDYYNLGPNLFCPLCKRSCTEVTYEYVISSKLLSQSILSELVENYSSTHNIEDVKKNFAVGKFYLHEMVEIVIVEDFMFSAFDLFIYIGGSLGLFIGISVTSFYELFHQILFSTITFCLNVKSENKENVSIKPEVLDNKQHIPLESMSSENSLLKTKRLSTTKVSQRGKSKNFRAAVKRVQNETETAFMNLITTKSVSVKRDEDLISVESEVGIHTQPRLHTKPSRAHLYTHRLVTRIEEGEENVLNCLTKVEVHAVRETRGMYGLFKITNATDAVGDGL